MPPHAPEPPSSRYELRAAMAVVGGSGASAVVFFGPLVQPPLPCGVLAAAVAASAAVIIWAHAANAGTRRRVEDLSYRCCLHCEHDLTGLGDNGVCPECAAPYAQVRLRDGWTHRFSRAGPGRA